jgi:hypothetical protein
MRPPKLAKGAPALSPHHPPSRAPRERGGGTLRALVSFSFSAKAEKENEFFHNVRLAPHAKGADNEGHDVEGQISIASKKNDRTGLHSPLVGFVCPKACVFSSLEKPLPGVLLLKMQPRSSKTHAIFLGKAHLHHAQQSKREWRELTYSAVIQGMTAP